MALLWFDGFESYNDADDMEMIGYNCHAVDIGTSSGRRSSRCLRLDQESFQSAGYVSVPVSGTPAIVIFGIAIYQNSNEAPTDDKQLFRIYDLFAGGLLHLTFHANADRSIRIEDSADSILATSDTGVLSSLQWFYLEVKVTISGTVGQITIKKDGVSVLSTAANLNTLNGSNAYVGRIDISLTRSEVMNYYDDFYICDNSGTKNNDFLGDVRVDPVRPDGAGTHTDFSPSAGSNYQNVDETYPDGDTTYNDGSGVADQDSYGLPALPSPAGTTIYGVKDQITVRKTDAGSRQCKLLTVQGGSDYLGDAIILSDTYITETRIMEDNPDDSAAWEDADISGGEIGVEITVSSSSSSKSSSSSSSSSSA